MIGLSDHIRKIVLAIKKEYRPKEVRIFFEAPKDPSKTLTVGGPENFQWRAFKFLFSDKSADKFYLYETELNTDGSEKSPQKITESTPLGKSLSEYQTPDIAVEEAKKVFPKLLKGPALNPDTLLKIILNSELEKGDVIYKNRDKSEYDPESFKEKFSDISYAVVRPGKSKIINPVTLEEVGRKPVEEEEQK